jgi:regulator of sigma D
VKFTDKEMESWCEYWIHSVNSGNFDVADRIEKELRDCGIKLKLTLDGLEWQRIEEQINQNYATQCINDYYTGSAD